MKDCFNYRRVARLTSNVGNAAFSMLNSGVPRGGGGFGVFKPPLKFRRYRWSPRSHEQEEPASQFPFVVHCVLIRF
jgi:hypothetical protein